ncbi:MAG: biotin--[acetyl-CoA-carboxylase] ligase [Mariprofundaceae bacterium]|nr:biotin--[acetyl-CoA-carboxylase] ligase [Mariprofundaceae bacterium]
MNRTRDAILARLVHADAPVSGDRLACELDISRTAIWKHIRTLQQTGIHIRAYKGRGYTLESDVLNEYAITQQLNTRLLGQSCIVLDAVDSTNSETMRRANEGAREGLIVLADRQTAGRGRLQRRWHTIAEHTLAMSILLRPPLSPEKIPQISLLTAVALHDALSSFAPDVKIKWPNDILHHGRKMAGILTEMRAEPGRVQAVVVGMGVNVHAPEKSWPEDIAAIATDLGAASGRAVSRMEAAIRILESMERHYLDYLSHGFGPVREQWWQAHAACGKQVRVYDGLHYIEGIAEDLDEDGALLLRTHAGLQRIVAGDLELMEDKPAGMKLDGTHHG